MSYQALNLRIEQSMASINEDDEFDYRNFTPKDRKMMDPNRFQMTPKEEEAKILNQLQMQNQSNSAEKSMTAFATEQESVVNAKKIGAFFNKAKEGITSMWSKDNNSEHLNQSVDQIEEPYMGGPADQNGGAQAQPQVDSLNPALIAAVQFQNSRVRPTQNKPYCQLCYREFNMLIARRYHCHYCTRSCCSNCSSEEVEAGDKVRHCEYCIVKMQNSQIEQFYQLGKLWREAENAMIQQKTEWYKQKQAELKLSVETERESIHLDREALERDFIKMEQQKKSIESQKQYVASEKDKLLQHLQLSQEQRQDVLDRVEELRQKKLKLVLERSRTEQTLMKRIKAKEELFKRMQELDERRLDLSEIKENEDSFVQRNVSPDLNLDASYHQTYVDLPPEYQEVPSDNQDRQSSV